MPYSGDVIRRATEVLQGNVRQHRGAFEEKKERIYRELPELPQIDRQLSQTVRRAAQTALIKGVDPGPVIALAKRQNLALQQRRRELLASRGYTPEDLTYKPMCLRCEDKGWKGAEMCRCLQTLCGREQIKDLSSMLNLGDQSFDTFSLDYYSPVYEPAYGGSARFWAEGALDTCFRYANRFGRNPVKNLFLTGAPGLGKTFLSASIARMVSEQGYSVVYDSAVTVFNRFEAQKFNRDPDASTDVDRYLTCDLMILDDLGSEMTSQFTQAALYQLVNSRLLGDKHTVISSNLSLDDLRARYVSQVYSRIAGEYMEVPFHGEDIRRQKKERAQRGY